MAIFEVVSKLNKKIRLDEDSWIHISVGHSELKDKFNLLADVVRSPDIIFYDKSNDNFRYCKYFNNLGRNLVVVVRLLNDEGFIITSYYAKKVQKFDSVIVYERI